MKIYNAKVTYVESGQVEVPKMDKLADAVAYMQTAFDDFPKQESLWALMLDPAGNVVGRTMLALGTATQVGCTPVEVFRTAIVAGAQSIVLFHNHPQGDPHPSDPDKEFTYKMVKAGVTLGLRVLDHIIVGGKDHDPDSRGFYSMAHNGKEMDIILKRVMKEEFPLNGIESLLDQLIRH